MPDRRSAARAALPMLVLVAVAGTQVLLAKTRGLSAWKGGGFGMFSTLDDAQHRDIRIVVEAPGRAEELALTSCTRDEAVKAMTLPTDHRLSRFAATVAACERGDGRDVATIRVTVWRHDVDVVSLRVTPVVMREYEHHVGS